jgi:D-proline reductase (dithiol) PrdB
VGLIARTIEEAGIPTVYIGSCRDMMARVKAPRAVFVDFPLGRQCGKPNDPELQMSILQAALRVLEQAQAPGTLVELPFGWGEPFDWASYQRDMEEMLRDEGETVQQWKASTAPA